MNTNTFNWNEQVQGAVLAMKDDAKAAYTYVKQEAPEFGREYIRWQIVKGVVGATPLLIASAIGFAFAVNAYQIWKKERVEICNKFHRGDWGLGVVMACIVSCFLLGAALASASTSMKALVAPRIVILDGIMEVVK